MIRDSAEIEAMIIDIPLVVRGTVDIGSGDGPAELRFYVESDLIGGEVVYTYKPFGQRKFDLKVKAWWGYDERETKVRQTMALWGTRLRWLAKDAVVITNDRGSGRISAYHPLVIAHLARAEMAMNYQANPIVLVDDNRHQHYTVVRTAQDRLHGMIRRLGREAARKRPAPPRDPTPNNKFPC